MKQSRHHLANVIGEKTMHAGDSKQLAQEIAAYLLHEKHTADLESLMRDVMQYRADRGVIEATAVSTAPLGDQVIRDVKQLLAEEYPDARTIIVREKRDADIVGGIRIDLANEQLDMSIKSKLSTFKRLTAMERNKA